MPPTFLPALAGFFGGYAQDQEANRQRQRQAGLDAQNSQAFGMQQQLHGVQMQNVQSEMAARQAAQQRQEASERILREHYQNALAGDKQAQALIVSVRPDLANDFMPKPVKTVGIHSAGTLNAATGMIEDVLDDGSRRVVRKATPQEIAKANHIPAGPVAPPSQILQTGNGFMAADPRDPSKPAVAIKGPDGHPLQTQSQSGRALPSSAVEKIAAIDNVLSQAQLVEQSLKTAISKGTNATGRVLGVVPTANWMKNAAHMGGQEGEETRTDIGSLFSTIAKERGGTALSRSELDILESFIPNGNEDEGTAYRKAVKFIRALKTMRANKIKAYSQFGYGVDDESPPGDQAPPGPGALSPDDRAKAASDPKFAAWLRANGKLP